MNRSAVTSLLMAAGVGCLIAAPGNAAASAPGAEYLEKYKNVSSVRQIVLVKQSPRKHTDATLSLYVKNTAGEWAKRLSCSAYLGKNGIGKVKEGDGKTPTGDFGFSMAFGAKNDPGSRIPYTRLTQDMYVCGDKEYYNQFIDLSKVSHKCTDASEHLIRYIPQYNYAMFIDYNKEGVYGKGSAIFLHCNGKRPYTAGCVSVTEKDMLTLLKTLDPGARICIF